MISTHTPHARRDRGQELFRGISRISTHTPHARRDRTEVFQPSLNTISTHTPHARRDVNVRTFSGRLVLFQLTRLMRGVTISNHFFFHLSLFQLTRLMRGVTLSFPLCPLVLLISTHTPHARRDVLPYFLFVEYEISTHTPHARRDFFM